MRGKCDNRIPWLLASSTEDARDTCRRVKGAEAYSVLSIAAIFFALLFSFRAQRGVGRSVTITLLFSGVSTVLAFTAWDLIADSNVWRNLLTTATTSVRTPRMSVVPRPLVYLCARRRRLCMRKLLHIFGCYIRKGIPCPPDAPRVYQWGLHRPCSDCVK